jgi:hypothetical protein
MPVCNAVSTPSSTAVRRTFTGGGMYQNENGTWIRKLTHAPLLLTACLIMSMPFIATFPVASRVLQTVVPFCLHAADRVSSGVDKSSVLHDNPVEASPFLPYNRLRLVLHPRIEHIHINGSRPSTA